MKHPVTADNALRYCRYLVFFLFSMPFRLQSPARAWQLTDKVKVLSKRSRQPIHKIKEGSGTGCVLPRLRMTHWGRPNCNLKRNLSPIDDSVVCPAGVRSTPFRNFAFENIFTTLGNAFESCAFGTYNFSWTNIHYRSFYENVYHKFHKRGSNKFWLKFFSKWPTAEGSNDIRS